MRTLLTRLTPFLITLVLLVSAWLPSAQAQQPDAGKPPAAAPAMGPPTPPPAPPIPAHEQTPAEALAQDAGEYAQQFGVALDEAERRLRAQEESVALTDRLEEVYKDRVAGISIEHSPAWRIAVFLTGTQPVPEQRAMLGGMSVPIVFRTGAKATRERVIWAMTYHQPQIRALLANPPAMGLDPRTGELVIVVGPKTVAAYGKPEALKARVAELAGVPVQIRVQDRIDVNLDVEGGSRLEGVSPTDGKRYVCTSGFVVTDGLRNAVVTAAHCEDGLTYLDPARGATPLSFVAQWGWGYRDVQVHLADPAVALRPLFYADTARTLARPVTGQRSRESTRAGDFLCHRGEKTGYHCAVVELTDFAPAGDLCGGPCLPTWVTVAGPHCRGGDSGGPVFVGTVAFGIVKGASYRPDGSCAFYYYMSTDYLPSGWSLLRAPPAAEEPVIAAASHGAAGGAAPAPQHVRQRRR